MFYITYFFSLVFQIYTVHSKLWKTKKKGDCFKSGKVVSSITCDFFGKFQKLLFIVPALIINRNVFSTLHHLAEGIPDMLDNMQILLLKYIFFYLTVCTHICQHWCNKDQLSDCLKFCASRMIWGIPKMWSYLYCQSNLAKDGFRGNNLSILWMLAPPGYFLMCKKRWTLLTVS